MSRLRVGAPVAAVTAAAALLALGAAGPASAGPARAAATQTVTLRNIEFTPANVKVARGGSVRFVWRDADVTHNVTSQGRLRFHSASNRKKGSVVVRFTRAGTYRYACTIHYGMKGTITVK
jgi:plastocyanin